MKNFKKFLFVFLSAIIILLPLSINARAEDTLTLSVNIAEETTSYVKLSIKLTNGSFKCLGVNIVNNSDELEFDRYSRTSTWAYYEPTTGYLTTIEQSTVGIVTMENKAIVFLSFEEFSSRDEVLVYLTFKKNSADRICKDDITLTAESADEYFEGCETKTVDILNNLPEFQDVHQHKYIVYESQSPDCTHGGYAKLRCKCGLETTETYDPLGHNWTDWKTYQYATCTECEIQERNCRECGETEYREYGEPYGHYYAYNPTIYVPSTCIQKGYIAFPCTICENDYYYVYDDKFAPHDFAVTKVDPTCAESGYIEYTCKVCGYSYKDILSPLGHKYGENKHVEPTCTNEGYDYSICSECGDKLITYRTEPYGHSCDWYNFFVTVIDREPTNSQKGLRHCRCQNCNETIFEEFEYQGNPKITWYLPSEMRVGDSFENKGYYLEITNLMPCYQWRIQEYVTDYSGTKHDTFSVESCLGGMGDVWWGDTFYWSLDENHSKIFVPGTLTFTFSYYDSNGKLLYSESESIVIKEPIITDNAPSQALAGTTYTFSTALSNIGLENEPLSKYAEALEDSNKNNMEYVFFEQSEEEGHAYLAYKPEIEIIEGKDLVKQLNQDYSKTLSTTEILQFVKAGTVKLKIKYNQINTCGHCLLEEWYYNEDDHFENRFVDKRYSFEKIVTINIVDPNSDYLLGDVNNDSFINSADALLMLQHSVGNITLVGEEFAAADIDKNGVVNSADALLVLQYSVGIINNF